MVRFQARVNMAKIKLDDISMYYEVHGTGVPIVFIAGFSADHTTWSEVVDKFKDKYQVILFDNRGAGQTDAPEGPYSIEQMTHDVVLLCSSLGIKSAHFIGNSMGGFILQMLACHYPGLVKSAVISHSTSTIHSCFHIYLAAQLELMKAKAPLASIMKATCSWVFSYSFLSKPEVLQQLIDLGLANPYPMTIEGYEAQFAAIEQFESKSWVHKIHVPTLVLASAEDLIFSEPAVKLLANQISNAKYYCFESCGHLPQIEYPEKFSSIIQEFFETPGAERVSTALEAS